MRFEVCGYEVCGFDFPLGKPGLWLYALDYVYAQSPVYFYSSFNYEGMRFSEIDSTTKEFKSKKQSSTKYLLLWTFDIPLTSIGLDVGMQYN